MPDIDLQNVSAGLVTALDGSLGAGRTHRGRFTTPPGPLPCAAVSAPDVGSQQGPVMGQYTRTCVWGLQVWGRPSSGDQVAYGEGLLDQVLSALEVDRLSAPSALYTLATFEVRAATIVAGVAPLPANVVVVSAVIEATYRRRTGLAGKDTP